MALLILASLFISILWVVDATTYYEPGGAKLVGARKGPIGGDCWNGELCKELCLTNATLAQNVGSLNHIPVCCPYCESSGLYLSSRDLVCNCRRQTYVPTAEEQRRVEEIKRRINSAPTTSAGGFVIFGLVMFSSICSTLPPLTS